MKILLTLSVAYLSIIAGCSHTADKTIADIQKEAEAQQEFMPMILVNPGSVIYTSVEKPVVIFSKDIIINITETETLITFTNVVTGNRTTVKGDIDISFLKSKDYKIIDWRNKK